MARSDLDIHLGRVDQMVKEIEAFIPEGTAGATDFRADLAGLLVVAMASAYESCVKDVLISHAATKHGDFERFVSNSYSKLSSRISEADLNRYAKLFDVSVYTKFRHILIQRRDAISAKRGFNIVTRYEQILSWRHDFAHAGIRNTTISEAVNFHMYAKRVLYCFDEAFS